MAINTVNTINRVLRGVVVFLVISLVLQSIIMSYVISNRFDWQVGIVTSENYPMQIIECTHYYNWRYDNKILRNTWDDGLSTTDYRMRDKSFPKQFTIKWYSYNEDRFFEALIPLPSDTLNYYAKKYRTYYSYGHNLVAELKPDGMVSVWLTDGSRDGEKIELYSNFQGIETDLDERELIANKEFTRKEWNDIITTRKYNWKIVPVIEELPDDNQIKRLEVDTYTNITYNCIADPGRRENDSSLTNPQVRYIPNGIEIKWQGNQGKSFSTSFSFQAKAISDIFAELYEDADRLQQSEIVIRLDRYFEEKHDGRVLSRPYADTDYYDAIITLRRGDKNLSINTRYGSSVTSHSND